MVAKVVVPHAAKGPVVRGTVGAGAVMEHAVTRSSASMALSSSATLTDRELRRMKSTHAFWVGVGVVWCVRVCVVCVSCVR